jgi:hypothetical protein
MSEQEKILESSTASVTTEAAAPAPILIVGPGEFAIETGALFDFVGNGTSVIVRPDRTVTVTLNFRLQDRFKIFTENENISQFDSGVFDTTPKEIFLSAVVQPLSLFQDANKKISLKSSQNDVTLATIADKGRQGHV